MEHDDDVLVLTIVLIALASISIFGITIAFLQLTAPTGIKIVLAIVSVITAIVDVRFAKHIWAIYHH
jgi:hypothetical protein